QHPPGFRRSLRSDAENERQPRLASRRELMNSLDRRNAFEVCPLEMIEEQDQPRPRFDVGQDPLVQPAPQAMRGVFRSGPEPQGGEGLPEHLAAVPADEIDERRLGPGSGRFAPYNLQDQRLAGPLDARNDAAAPAVLDQKQEAGERLIVPRAFEK